MDGPAQTRRSERALRQPARRYKPTVRRCNWLAPESGSGFTWVLGGRWSASRPGSSFSRAFVALCTVFVSPEFEHSNNAACRVACALRSAADLCYIWRCCSVSCMFVFSLHLFPFSVHAVTFRPHRNLRALNDTSSPAKGSIRGNKSQQTPWDERCLTNFSFPSPSWG